MTPKELRAKKETELAGIEEKLKTEIGTLSIKTRLGQVADTTRHSKIKKDIARILTIRAEKSLSSLTKEKN